MKKKILFTLTIILIISSCGMGRPMPPSIVTRYSGNWQPWSDNSGYGVTTSFLSNVALLWDVSDVPGAIGVEIITAKHSSCQRDIIFTNPVNMIKNNNIDIIQHNLQSLYSPYTLEPGLYYICIKIIKANYSKSPASWPVTLNYKPYLYY